MRGGEVGAGAGVNVPLDFDQQHLQAGVSDLRGTNFD